MKTLFDDRRRSEIQERLGRLTPVTAPQWGKFDASRMVAHLGDSLKMALGTLPVKSKRLPIRHPPLKQLIIYWAPWPKGTPTAPELIARSPGDWSAEVSELSDLVDRVAAAESEMKWPEHPAFGRMTPRAWGVLTYRHVDHHFRQFGI
jgi:hypothetical protein